MTLRARILLLFAAVVLVAATGWLAAYATFLSIDANMRQIRQSSAVEAVASLEMEQALTAIAKVGYRPPNRMPGDGGARSQRGAVIAAAVARFREQVAVYIEASATAIRLAEREGWLEELEEERRENGEVCSLAERFEALAEDLHRVVELERTDRAEADRMWQVGIVPELAWFDEVVHVLNRDAVGEMVRETQEGSRAVVRSHRLVAVAMTATILSAVGMALVALRSIGDPVRKLQAAARAIGRGDRAARVGLRRTDELGMLGRTFDEMAVSLGEMEMRLQRTIEDLRIKHGESEQVLYTISHDLKAPLITAQGFLSELDLHLKGATPTVREDLHRVVAAVARMSSLLDDVLELAKVRRERIAPARVALREIVREVVDAQMNALNVRGVDVRVAEDLPVVWADRRLMVVVLRHLISNAVKSLGGQTESRVAVEWRQEASTIVCEVRDNGTGIAKENLEKVFGLFQKSDRRTAGAGLGLPLVRRIIDVHGGRVWAESEGLGAGAGICFTLPGSPPEKETS